MDRTVTIQELIVTVNELTVSDVRDWLKSMSEREDFDIVNAGLFKAENCTIDDLLFMTDIDKAELDQLTPTQIILIIDKAKKVNPHFFALRAMIVENAHQSI